MQNMLADKRNEFESKKSILNNMKEKLEQKKLSIQLKMEKRDKLKNEVQNLKVEDQIIELNNCKAKAAETKRFLNDVDLGCKENDLKIRDKSQEVHETKLHLKSMKNEYDNNSF